MRACLRTFFAIFAVASIASTLLAQDIALAPPSSVPHLVRFSGAAPEAPSAASVVEVKFALYAQPSGGEPLWSEMQQVPLDPAGKFSVFLGAATAAGVPQGVFSSTEARWVGVSVNGAPEQPRAILAAAAYSLKASDAETVGGHPPSDFVLAGTSANGKPNAATNITQISGSNGVLVNSVANSSATGPSVALALDGSYLSTLGNSIYAQLKAANTFTGNQTITGNLSISGSINSPYLNSLAAQVPTLSGNNTLSGTQTISGSGANQLNVTTSASGGTAVRATASSSTGTALYGYGGGTGVYGYGSTYGVYGYGTSYGVYGYGSTYGLWGHGNYYGVYGTTPSSIYYGVWGTDTATSNGTGVYGTAADGVGGTGVFGAIGGSLSATGALFEPGKTYGPPGVGVWGDGPSNSVNGGVLGTSDDNWGGEFVNNGADNSTLFVLNLNSQPTTVQTGYFAGSAMTDNCAFDAAGNLTCTGTVTPSVTHADGRMVSMYSAAATENWFEDYGSAALRGGAVTVTLDADFADLVNTGVEYHVFLTPNGDSHGLYVESKGPASFVVREQGGGNSNIAFDYKVVAKRKGYEKVRMADRTEIESHARAALARKHATLTKAAVN